jgi:hypothetical protein
VPPALRAALGGALALAAALALVAALGGGGGGSATGGPGRVLPPGFFGIVSEDVFAGSARYRRTTLRREARAGVRLIRQTFHWARIERRPGRYDLRAYDRYVAALSRARIRVLPVLFDPPAFRSSAPRRGRRRGTYPPRDPRAMGDLAAALARRYGPAGSFWRDHPGLPALPVRAWQVWNEPSLPVYWPSGPDPAAYVRLLRAVGAAIKRVDGGARVVSAGLARSRLGVPFERYLRGMYAAGAAGVVDVLAVHPFAADIGGVLDGVRTARAIAAAYGRPPALWVTELGWASGGPPSAFTVGERRQARLVGRTLRALVRRRRALGLHGVVYYDWRDARPYPGGRDFFGLHAGLVRGDGSAKPALAAYGRVAIGAER